jgi:hypothetical protein
MKKSDIKILPNHFDAYINLVDNNELLISFKQSLEFGKNVDLTQLKAKADFAYAPDKWTIKDLIQHLIDAERILSYRALRFARNDQTVLPGFDEESFSKNTTASQRSIDDLLAELIYVRNSSILLFKSFNDEMLVRKGKTFGGEIDVLSLGFSIIGHQLHHFNVINSRYLNH